MAAPRQIKGRYEISTVLGQGGMGLVYKAYDNVIKREVAVKTIRDVLSRTSLDLFYKECDVLASMSHPNIVEIFDIGEFEEDGANKPYFVMPLLPGTTLDKLIRAGSNRLTVERSVEILSQTCRGLQAAHERGLIHRDLKPSNIFVMDDDSVKIIDFGVAHMADTQSTMGHKGTLLYMAPEQVEMKPASALSDIFSLGVVCYEMLTLRHPFERGNAAEVATAILKHIPPAVSELNPSVNQAISRVVHKAIAKQPWYRFATARELAENLQKAARNEPIEMFDAGRIQPRIERATKAFEQDDYQFADEILSELEVEGHVDSSIAALRRQLDKAQRQKTIAQLMENARRRFEEAEYPLALQKLQELLALDPANTAALALKSSIENKRSEQKIEDWFRLARQHMQQNAFSHARQALQNVLQLKPRDTRALQLVAEVDRQEQAFLRARQEKEQLYAKALEAWQSGEVSAALSKLELLVEIDRRSPDTGAPERSTAFQNFYNQVRSEHDAIKNAYEQARQNLVDGNFAAALAICNEQLARHAGQALFQALKFDVEEGQRQQLSARIAEIDRRVEAEPDLDKRVSILSEALERFPGESHFERVLRTMRDKRDLVNSIAGKARAHEERGAFADALGQWEILKTIYSQYPGLDFEVERVQRRRDQQLRSDAKMRWVEQIDWQLASGDHARARDLLEDAQAEFPGDAELAELAKQVTQALERTAEAQRLLAEGQQLCARQKFGEGIEILRRAHQLDEKNAAIRVALIGTLVEQARLQLDQDWQAAETLAQQALELDPANAQAGSLRTLALDRKREEFVNQCVAQARHLQSDGQLEAALKEVERGLSALPRETRLAQLHLTLTKAYAETKGSVATQSVVVPPPAPVSVAPPPVPTVEAPATETLAMTAPFEPRPPVPPPPPVVKPVAAKPHRTPWGRIAAGVAAVALVSGAAFVLPRLIRSRAPAPPPRAAAPAPAPAPAAPLQTSLRVFADLEGGKVLLDDHEAGEVQDGQFSLENLAPGKHTLKIAGRREEAVMAFESAPGAAPAISSLEAREVVAVTVTNLGGHAKVQSSSGPAAVSIDGKPAGETGTGGLEVQNLAPGNHELTVGAGKELRSMVVGIGPAPMLTAFLKSDRNIGTLVVVTGEDGVTVFLNGKPYRRETQRGQLRIPNLDVKEYAVRVAKDGFLDVPEQRAGIRKGEELKLEFKLRPAPTVATLAIQGAVAGTQVLLDQNPIGVVQDDGSFTASSVPAGDHTVELHKESYRAWKLEKHFVAGGSVHLTAAEVAMEKLPATLKLHVTPADARVTISRAGEAPKPVTETTLTLPEGSYTLSGHALNYADRSIAVVVAAGETKTVELALAKAAPAAPKAAGMADWDDPSGWTPEGGRHVRKGGNFVGFKPVRTTGTFVFSVELRKGKRLQWVAARGDPRNYVLFQMDKKYFYRAQVVNGKETQLKRVPHAMEKQSAFTLSMDVANGSIVHKLYDGAKWVPLDDWEEAGRAFGSGKFGFLLPGSDTVALSNFSFTPK